MTDSLDTCVALRCMLGDVPEQRLQAAEILKQPGSLHYFSNQALLECVYVMEKVNDMPRQEVADHITFFLARYNDTILYDNELVRIAFPLYLAHPKLSWTDCALAAEAEVRHHEPLMTFDRKLAAQAPQAKMVG